ncbi:SMI1/KNR4 family protein [Paenibacillus illinoisensis]|uniref:Cell wall assembly-cell proliferation coordinating protein KNR4-like protein n=1 Tax=Paenibacillus illinoisensis TaxID=59845 RepID=A0A2W0CEL7_9BACL|nr:SMI1/KNR4 family protein [Paenibacillus illinoisensis]PYY31126.1 Cell wall assembly-cell proliferation coordinating protein KNR4-like protein [Paenibacillus illinoisensis]
MIADFRVLAEFLQGHDEAGGSISEEDIQEQERRLGRPFPVVLREYYKRFGRSQYITQQCNNQYEPMLLEDIFVPDSDFFTTDKAFLVFYQCEESVIYCGIRFSDLTKEDPPVYLCAWNHPDWVLENESLTNFLVSKALIQMGVEDRLPYWVIFDESMWGLSDYRSYWGLSDEQYEIQETSSLQAWRIFCKEDVILLFEMAVGENEDDVLAVYLASFDGERIASLLSRATHDRDLPDYRTNLGS